MQNLRITTFQSTLAWEDPAANRAHFEQLFSSCAATDLMVLPEMFSTGFSMNPAPLAETMDGPTVNWMKQWAQKLTTAICGSLIITENGQYFNRFIVAFKDGKLLTYDKRHLFSMAGETNHYAAGNSKIIFELNGFRILPLICYDLRFPVWSRRTAENDYDILMYVANWPKPRVSAWSALLVGRAIENQCYVVGVNRVGLDGNGHEYVGQTAIIDSKGEPLYAATYNTEEVMQTTITLQELVAFREKFPVMDDADAFELR